MFAFGKWMDERATPHVVEDLLKQARQRATASEHPSTSSIIQALHRVGEAWTQGSHHYQHAMQVLPEDTGLSSPMVASTLDMLRELLQAPNLVQRVRSELGSAEIVDRFVCDPVLPIQTRAFPLGVVLHVSAANVFIGCIDSLVMALLTGNISILRESARNRSFIQLFLRSLLETDVDGVLTGRLASLHWDSQDKVVESLFKQSVDAILAWGGQEMLRSYREGLKPGTRLLEFGPRISFQVITAQGLEGRDLTDVGRSLAHEIATWDQQACASPQNLFVDDQVNVRELMRAIAHGFTAEPARGELDADEHVEILKEKFRGKVSRLVKQGDDLEGAGFYLHLDPTPGLRASPLNRTLIIKRFTTADDLGGQLSAHATHLQSCSLLAGPTQRGELITRLGALGVKRFTNPGCITHGVDGTPHDGRHVLRDLIFLCVDEAQARTGDVMDVVRDARQHVPCYRSQLEGRTVTSLQEVPVSDKSLFARHPVHRTRDLLHQHHRSGLVFSSGGTSGAPKYSFYSAEEFNQSAQLLARSYTSLGVRSGDVVANVFAAGNLWSSFLVVEKALEMCQAFQLPIGGTTAMDTLLGYLEQFRPRVMCGLPSLMVSYANACQERGIQIHIPLILYAGEHLTAGGRETLQRIFGTLACHSAGYASVDAGLIGYQCPHCKEGEHHLFSQHVHLEVLDQEAVVTSLLRRAMPILRYRTGDRVRTDLTQSCPCGSPDPRFVLLGRMDGQIHLWSCKFQVHDIERALHGANIGFQVLAVELREERREGSVHEYMRIRAECEYPDAGNIPEIKRSILRHCPDVMATHPADFFLAHCELQLLPPGSLERVDRTGKVRTILDTRTP